MASNTIEHVVKIDTAQARADVDSFAAHVASRLKALESPVKIGVGLPSTAVTPSAPGGGSGISVNPMQGALSTNIALKTMTNGIMAATQAIQAFTSQLASFRVPMGGTSAIAPRIVTPANSGFFTPVKIPNTMAPTSSVPAAATTTSTTGASPASGGFSRLGTAMASGISAMFGPIGSAISMVTGILGSVLGGLFSAFSTLGEFLLSIPGMIMGAVKTIGMAVGAIAASFAGAAFATHKALGPAAEMERYKSQLDFMKKPELLDFYKQLALQSPLSLKETVGAGILSENYGLNSKQYLPLFTDMAAALKKPIDEFARTFGWAKGGNTGFAFENARQWGISQQMMEAKGIRFDANGGVKDEDKTKFLGALTEIAQKKFGGMAASMAGGYEQLVSNLGDAIFQAFAKAGSGQGGASSALTWGKEIVKSITDTITFFGDKLSAIDWAGIGASFSVVTDKIGEAFKASNWQSWTDSFSRTADRFGNAVESLTTWSGLQEAGKLFANIWDIVISKFPALGEILYNSMTRAAKEAGKLIWEGIKGTGSMVGEGSTNLLDFGLNKYPMLTKALFPVQSAIGMYMGLGQDTGDKITRPGGDSFGEILAQGNDLAKKTAQELAAAISLYMGTLVPSSDKIDKIAYQRTKGIGEKVARGEYEPDAKSIFPYSENIRKNLEASLKTPEQRQQDLQQKMLDTAIGNFDILKTALNAVKGVQQTQEAIATMTSQMLEELRQQSQISQSAFSESFQL